jgi:2-polyprenyl-3-methyl-5-hydroxy-6-metoxy-1,4-benzoquinol methylase
LTTASRSPAQTCSLCGSGSRLLAELDGRNLRVCEGCGLVFTDVSSMKTPPGELYSSDYFEETHRFFAEDARKVKRYAWGLKKLAELGKREGRLLDVGCGTGDFLKVAREQGWQGEGVEISPWASEKARGRGLKVTTGILDDLPDDPVYDVVTLWDVIEHVEDPSAVIGKCRRMLRPGGFILVLTVNEDGFIPQLSLFLHRLSGGKMTTPVAMIHPIHHVNHFSARHLAGLLRNHGFEVLIERPVELPLSDIEGGAAKKALIAVLYGISWVLTKQWQVIDIARSPLEGEPRQGRPMGSLDSDPVRSGSRLASQ